MDELVTLKAEVYDLLAKQQQLQELLQQKNRRIIELSKQKEEPKAE